MLHVFNFVMSNGWKWKKSSKINFLYSKTWTDQINVIYSKNELTNIDQSKNLLDNLDSDPSYRAFMHVV